MKSCSPEAAFNAPDRSQSGLGRRRRDGNLRGRALAGPTTADGKNPYGKKRHGSPHVGDRTRGRPHAHGTAAEVRQRAARPPDRRCPARSAAQIRLVRSRRVRGDWAPNQLGRANMAHSVRSCLPTPSCASAWCLPARAATATSRGTHRAADRSRRVRAGRFADRSDPYYPAIQDGRKSPKGPRSARLHARPPEPLAYLRPARPSRSLARRTRTPRAVTGHAGKFELDRRRQPGPERCGT